MLIIMVKIILQYSKYKYKYRDAHEIKQIPKVKHTFQRSMGNSHITL